jgi:hypothetical protein
LIRELFFERTSLSVSSSKAIKIAVLFTLPAFSGSASHLRRLFGVVIQLKGGSLKAISPEEAREHLSDMSPELRMLYE